MSTGRRRTSGSAVFLLKDPMAARPVSSRASNERRRFPRVRAGATTRMTVASEGDALILIDLSHAGCAVESRYAFGLGDEMHLTFTIDTCLSFIVPVRVMYSQVSTTPRTRTHRYIAGFEFVPLRQPDIHRIVEILLEASNEPLSVH